MTNRERAEKLAAALERDPRYPIDVIARALNEATAAAESRAREVEADAAALRAGLTAAIQAAFDGPAEAVGTDCKESYREWRQRMEREARAALESTAGTTLLAEFEAARELVRVIKEDRRAMDTAEISDAVDGYEEAAKRGPSAHRRGSRSCASACARWRG